MQVQEPRRCPHLGQDRKRAFVGAGPRLSLDQKISFIQENNHLAKRITTISRRNAKSCFRPFHS
jgi:hypothetical protein